jgi:hypothetical protein
MRAPWGGFRRDKPGVAAAAMPPLVRDKPEPDTGDGVQSENPRTGVGLGWLKTGSASVCSG